MKVEINCRGNGACSLCNTSKNCKVQSALSKAVLPFAEEDNPMELVVYSCPSFLEKAEDE